MSGTAAVVVRNTIHTVAATLLGNMVLEHVVDLFDKGFSLGHQVMMGGNKLFLVTLHEAVCL